MSGSSDYTTTPNLGLYKPTFDADVDQWGMHWNSNADTLDAALATGSGGRFLPLAGGTVDPNGLTVSNTADHAHGVVIKPIGMYDPLPSTPQAQVYSEVDLAQGRGGPYFNPTFAGQFISTVYQNMDQSAVGLLGQANFNGTGGVGQHVGVQAYANRYTNVAQPTTTVSTTLSTPGNTISIADVSMFQMDYQPILINGNGYVQVSHTGTSGPGTIALDHNVTVADGTAGHVVTGQNNPQMWGLNINVNDNANNQNITSSKLSNYAIGCELDLGVSGMDDAGSPLFGSPAGIRAMITCIGLGGTSGNPAEIADGILVARGGGATLSWKRVFRAGDAPFSQSAFDTRQATQLSGANAVWLATGHSIALDTNAATKFSSDGTQTTLTGSLNVGAGGALNDPLVVATNAANYCRVRYQGGRVWSAGVLPNGSYVIGDETAGAGRLSIDTSGNVTAAQGLTVSGAITGNSTATFTDPTSNSSGNADFTFAAPNNVWGVNILLRGNGTNPNKTIRVGSGNFNIVNNALGANILVLDDVGNLTINGTLSIDNGGSNAVTWTSGTAAPATTQPVGSLYSRVGGAVGATLYVSRGGGTWAAIAGV